jgi:hypothetical protein
VTLGRQFFDCRPFFVLVGLAGAEYGVGGSIWQNPSARSPARRQDGLLYVRDAKDCSLIRVSEVLVALKNERVLPTAEGVVIRPGSEW